MKRNVILLLLVFIVPFIYVFFRTSHFFVFHDGIFHLQRTYDFFLALKEGNIPVRWTSFLNNNFGSPIFVFLFPVPYFISSFFYLLTSNLLLSYKLSNIFLIIIFCLGTYFVIKRIFNDKFIAVFSTGIALFTPYCLVQIFIRGAYREFAAMSLFPWVVFFLLKLYDENSLRNAIRLAVAASLCFLSDGLTFYTLCPYLGLLFAVLILASKNRKSFLISAVGSLLLFISLNSFILFPYIFEIKYIRPNLIYEFYKSHFVFVQNLFSLKWNFGFSEKWFPDRMPLQIGVLQTLCFFFAFFSLIKEKKGGKKIDFRKLLLFSSLINVIFILTLATENVASQFLWDKASYLRIIQFPWRLYSSLPISFAICGAYYFYIFKKRFPHVTVYANIFICLLPLLVSLKYLKSNQILVINEPEIISKQGRASAFDEFIPAKRDTTSDFDKTNLRYKVIDGKMAIGHYQQKSQEISFRAEVHEKGTLQVNQLYFPGWQVYVDHRLAAIGENVVIPEIGRIISKKEDVSDLFWLKLNSGNHQVTLKFEETTIRKLGNLISAISVILLITLYTISPLLAGRNIFPTQGVHFYS